MALRASIEWHDDLTWGELRAFVRLGEHMDERQLVAHLLSPHDDDSIGFTVDLPTGGDA